MTLCANCREREGTELWVGDGGALALVHGMSVRWCRRCVITAQLAHARAMAAQVPSLERELEQES
jgi:hypothetical protein